MIVDFQLGVGCDSAVMVMTKLDPGQLSLYRSGKRESRSRLVSSRACFECSARLILERNWKSEAEAESDVLRM